MAGIRALLGLFPKTGDYESRMNQLHEEFQELLAFKHSKELREFHALEAQVTSEEFLTKKKDIIDLRYKNTDDYPKEKEYQQLKKASDIKLYYKIKNSESLKHFREVENSEVLARYNELAAYTLSEAFIAVKAAASLPAKVKFAQSDLAKTLDQYQKQKSSDPIKSYFAFTRHKLYPLYQKAVQEDLAARIEKLEQLTNSAAFQEKWNSLSKSERLGSEEFRQLTDLQTLKKTKVYKAFQKMQTSPLRAQYESLQDSPELEAFVDLEKFIQSDDFKRQRKAIESKTFKNTPEFTQLQEYLKLKKSADIAFYQKFGTSKELKNFLALDGSERIQYFEETEAYITGDACVKFKEYCLKSPKKRWAESPEYELVQDYELAKKSEKIVWYHKAINHKRFAWHRTWNLTFSDEFSESKLDTSKWLTRYYWGDKMLKDTYSLSIDKHLVTDGSNIILENGRLHLVTQKESVKGKSWDARYGFSTRNFDYTSGLINSAKSFRQRYGIFEAKLKVSHQPDLLQAFWMVGKTMVPHIDVVKANRKLCLGNSWGDARNLSSVQRFVKRRGRAKFATQATSLFILWNGLQIS